MEKGHGKVHHRNTGYDYVVRKVDGCHLKGCAERTFCFENRFLPAEVFDYWHSAKKEALARQKERLHEAEKKLEEARILVELLAKARVCVQ